MTIREIAPAVDYLAGLNAEQRAAVEFGCARDDERDRPLLVIAGAGSGKTSTLVHRMVHLIREGADPGAMLLLTFSRRAAQDMVRRMERVAATAGERLAAQIAKLAWCGTFHAVGARLLREYAGRIGLEPGFTIHDRADSADLMDLVRHELGLSAQAKRFPQKGTCLAIYSAIVNTRAALDAVLQASYPWCLGCEAELKRLFRAYVEAKLAQRVLDYDDLLLYWAEMMAEPALAAELGARFSHVLVDEYQDTNALQATILLALKPDGRGVTVVGDDAQAIYAFRGASVRNILDFPAHFTPPAARVTLERNYRSTPAILAAANAVIALAPERYAKDLRSERPAGGKPRLVSVRDETAQADYVVERILARREEGVALKAQAVLFRTAHHSAHLELELTRRNIPYVKFGGLKFLEAAHVKDLLATLRFAQNPRDRVAGFRAIQLLAGLGPRHAGKVLDALAAESSRRFDDADGIPPAVLPAWAAFAAALGDAGAAGARWPADFERLCTWYLGELPRLYEDADPRGADVRQLARLAATYPNRERFLTELTLDPPGATSDEAGVPLRDEDYLILSTIHSAKGQEWTSVSVLNVVDGCLPSDLATGTGAEIEEERRLLYVAMTRAKDQLDLVVPQRFYVSGQSGHGDRHVYGSRSRFIPESLLARFEHVAWPAATGVAEARAFGVRVDLTQRMRARWE
ncbi:MAG: ATP-dependent helicase [Gammaproteobacteria bacterium]|nr:ATP-dependent helicase [Gammaproteobacteria bacterium]